MHLHLRLTSTVCQLASVGQLALSLAVSILLLRTVEYHTH